MGTQFKKEISEFDEWIAKYPTANYIDAFVNDLNNIVRGKRIPVAEAKKIWSEGLFMPSSLFCLDATGDDLNPCGKGISDGDPDGLWRPIPGTLCDVPWAKEKCGQVLLAHFESDGGISHVDPRAQLARLLDRYKEKGWMPVVALEMEFYLIDPKRDEKGRLRPSLSPANGLPEASKQPYSIADLDLYNEFIRDVARAAKVQGVPASTAITEFSPGQFEINLLHQADPLSACDHAVLLKRIIQNIALHHGFKATFMAKPFPDCAGSGLHMHASLQDEKGRNIFASSAQEGAITLHHAIGGTMALMAESMAYFAPNGNSYRRYQPGAHVARQAGWAVNNRSVACRIPLGPPASRRIEHRLAGADANPYLALAALLAGMLHGLLHQIEPGPPLTGDATNAIGLPTTWWDSLRIAREGKELKQYMGAAYHELYLQAKELEMQRFFAVPTAHEYDWYA